MILVLDTTAYSKRDLHELHFSALTRLCRHGLVELKIPFIVDQEVLTQRKKEAKDLINQTQKALTSLGKSPILGLNVKEHLGSIRPQIQELEKAANPDKIQEDWNVWKENASATVLPLNADQSQRAFEAYFNGLAPLTEAKRRADIPDSFIYQQILELKNNGNVTAISADKKMFDALSATEGITAYRTLKDYLDSFEVDVLISGKAMTNLAPYLQKNLAALEEIIKRDGGDEICYVGLPFEDPNSNPNEHSISSYNEPSGISFNFEEITSYGGGEYGISFTFENVVLVEYFIDCDDCWDSDDHTIVSVSKWNDQVYQAEQYSNVTVKGVLRINAPLDESGNTLIDFDKTEFAELEMKIDSITDITQHDD